MKVVLDVARQIPDTYTVNVFIKCIAGIGTLLGVTLQCHSVFQNCLIKNFSQQFRAIKDTSSIGNGTLFCHLISKIIIGTLNHYCSCKLL